MRFRNVLPPFPPVNIIGMECLFCKACYFSCDVVRYKKRSETYGLLLTEKCKLTRKWETVKTNLFRHSTKRHNTWGWRMGGKARWRGRRSMRSKRRGGVKTAGRAEAGGGALALTNTLTHWVSPSLTQKSGVARQSHTSLCILLSLWSDWLFYR